MADQTTRPSDSQQKKEYLPHCGLYPPGRPQNKIKKKAKRETNIITLQWN